MSARGYTASGLPVWTLLGAVFLGQVACAPRVPRQGARPCLPATGQLAEGTDPTVLVGHYKLMMVATKGPAGDATATGTLHLWGAEEGVRGSAEVSLDQVGAHTAGDVSSDDPMAPGVLALPERDMILLRLGANANRSGAQAIEGPYTVLHVRFIADSGFSGTWASGAMRTEAEGYFCAVRVTN